MARHHYRHCRAHKSHHCALKKRNACPRYGIFRFLSSIYLSSHTHRRSLLRSVADTLVNGQGARRSVGIVGACCRCVAAIYGIWTMYVRRRRLQHSHHAVALPVTWQSHARASKRRKTADTRFGGYKHHIRLARQDVRPYSIDGRQ